MGNRSCTENRLGQRRLTSKTRSSERGPLLVDVNDGCRRKSVEPGRRSIAVSADVFRIDQIIDLEVRQLLRLRNGVQTITGLPVDRADFGCAFFKRLEMILAMVKNDAGERVIDAVVNEVAELSITHSFADDPCDEGGGRGNEKSARLREDLHVSREQSVDLGVDHSGEQAERLHMPVIGDRKAAAYVEDFDLMATGVRLSQYRCRNIKSLNEVLEVGASAAHAKAHTRTGAPFRAAIA